MKIEKLYIGRILLFLLLISIYLVPVFLLGEKFNIINLVIFIFFVFPFFFVFNFRTGVLASSFGVQFSILLYILLFEVNENKFLIKSIIMIVMSASSVLINKFIEKTLKECKVLDDTVSDNDVNKNNKEMLVCINCDNVIYSCDGYNGSIDGFIEKNFNIKVNRTICNNCLEKKLSDIRKRK